MLTIWFLGINALFNLIVAFFGSVTVVSSLDENLTGFALFSYTEINILYNLDI